MPFKNNKILSFCLSLCPLVYDSRKETVVTEGYKPLNISQIRVLSWKERSRATDTQRNAGNGELVTGIQVACTKVRLLTLSDR